MNKDKLFMVGISSVVGGLFGGVVCQIKRALFENEKPKNTKEGVKKFFEDFGQGFCIGAVLGGLMEASSYDRKEEFKNRAIEAEVQRRTAGK
jgi:hypothetical protein